MLPIKREFGILSVKDLASKISILLQTVLRAGAVNPFQSAHLNNDTRSSLGISQRVLQGAISYLGDSADHFCAYLQCFILQKALKMRMWSDGPQVLRQIEGIGPKKVAQLVNHGIATIEQLRNISSGKIESLCDRNPPFGYQVKQRLRNFPTIIVEIAVHNDLVKTKIKQCNPEFEHQDQCFMTVLVGLSDGKFLLSRKLRLKNGISEHEISVKDIPKLTSSEMIVFASLDSLSGCDVIIRHSLNQSQISTCTDNHNHTQVKTERVRKSKHEHSLEEQSQIMRQSLCHSPNKKMRISTPMLPQQRLIQALPLQQRVRRPEKAEQIAVKSVKDRPTSLKSNIGYSRAALRIHSTPAGNIIRSGNQVSNGKESFYSRLDADMKDDDIAIGNAFSQCQPSVALSNVGGTDNHANVFDLDQFRYRKSENATTTLKQEPTSESEPGFNPFGQLAIGKTGGTRLPQLTSSTKDSGSQNFLSLKEFSTYPIVNLQSKDELTKQKDTRTFPATKANGFDFCDEQLVFSSLFED